MLDNAGIARGKIRWKYGEIWTERFDLELQQGVKFADEVLVYMKLIWVLPKTNLCRRLSQVSG